MCPPQQQLHSPHALPTHHRHHPPWADNERGKRHPHPRRTGKSQSSRNLLLDPLRALGSDVFHLVLTHLPIPALLAAEVTCSAWRDFIRNDNAVWRPLCLSHNVLYRTECHTKPPDYRALLLTRLPMNKAWAAGRVDFQYFRALRQAPVVFLPAFGVQVRSTAEGLLVAAWPDADAAPARHFTDPGVSQYNHLEASGRYIVGMRVDNQQGVESPKPLPTRIGMWRIIGDPGDNDLRLELVASPLQPRVWGKSLRLRTDSNGKTVLAVLASKCRLSGKQGSRNEHWVGVSQKTSVHVWHLDEGMRHKVVYIGSVGTLHSDGGNGRREPGPGGGRGQQAHLVVGTRDMVDDLAVWGERVSMRFLYKRSEMIAMFETGSRSTFGAATSNPAESDSNADAASLHDRQPTDLPSLPRVLIRGPPPDGAGWTADELKARTGDWYPECFSPLDGSPWPLLCTRVLQSFRPGFSRNGAMFMDPSGVYVPISSEIKAYTFGAPVPEPTPRLPGKGRGQRLRFSS